MAYIDGFVMAVPTANRQKFIDHATTFDALFIEFGATRVVEGWGDDARGAELEEQRVEGRRMVDEFLPVGRGYRHHEAVDVRHVVLLAGWGVRPGR